MKILLDENVLIKIKKDLIKIGYNDVKHINDIEKGLTDDEVYQLAIDEGRIIISGDNDFKKEKFKYNCGIIFCTRKAIFQKDIVNKIDWIIKNIGNYNIDINKAIIYINLEQYIISYKKGMKKEIREKKLEFKKLKLLSI